MKKFALLFIGAALISAVPVFAKSKKAEAVAEKTGEASTPNKVGIKPLPMFARADEIDKEGKSFTHVKADGGKVKHFVTDNTEIMQGDKPAKFGDIKQGDMVSGLRVKKNADGTEYLVLRISKFAPKAAKVTKEEAAEEAAEEMPEKKPSGKKKK
jgi:hypothetical protein